MLTSDSLEFLPICQPLMSITLAALIYMKTLKKPERGKGGTAKDIKISVKLSSNWLLAVLLPSFGYVYHLAHKSRE